ncbi:MAG: hypothetical protein AB7E21_16195 [Pseudodonghicola sp.]
MFPRPSPFTLIALLTALSLAPACTPVPELNDTVTADLRAAPIRR